MKHVEVFGPPASGKTTACSAVLERLPHLLRRESLGSHRSVSSLFRPFSALLESPGLNEGFVRQSRVTVLRASWLHSQVKPAVVDEGLIQMVLLLSLCGCTTMEGRFLASIPEHLPTVFVAFNASPETLQSRARCDARSRGLTMVDHRIAHLSTTRLFHLLSDRGEDVRFVDADQTPDSVRDQLLSVVTEVTV